MSILVGRPPGLVLILAPLLLTLLVAGCGYTPLYAPAEAGFGQPSAARPGVQQALAQIEVGQIADRSGQRLRRLLVDRLQPRGPVSPTAYRLSVGLREETLDLGVDKDDSIRRAQMVLRARLRLTPVGQGATDAAEPAVLLDTEVRSINSFNLLDNPFAARVNRLDARDRGLVTLSQIIADRLAVTLSQAPVASAP